MRGLALLAEDTMRSSGWGSRGFFWVMALRALGWMKRGNWGIWEWYQVSMELQVG